jgi:membrane protease YdiL (CAAX protease family)
MCIYVYYGTPVFFVENLSEYSGRIEKGDLIPQIYRFSCMWILFFLIPIVISRYILKLHIRDLGLCLGDMKSAAKIVAAGILISILPLYLGSFSPEMKAEYPMFRGAMNSASLFALWALLYLLFYIPWEFFFRGFMLFGFSKDVALTRAILIQTMASTLLHIGKPAPETFAAIIAGVAFGLIAWRTRSILAPVALHWGIGVLNDMFCAFF